MLARAVRSSSPFVLVAQHAKWCVYPLPLLNVQKHKSTITEPKASAIVEKTTTKQKLFEFRATKSNEMLVDPISITPSFLHKFINITIPFVRILPSDICIRLKNNKISVLNPGLRYVSPSQPIIFKANKDHNVLNVSTVTCRTKDNIHVIINADIHFKVIKPQDISPRDENVNSWFARTVRTNISSAIRDVSTKELFEDSTKTEEFLQEQINSVLKDLGMECNLFTFTSLIPPPHITATFERIACRKIEDEGSHEKLIKEQQVAYEMLRKQNEFKLEQTQKLVEFYGKTISSLAPHFETDGAVRAADAISKPSFCGPFDQIGKQMENIKTSNDSDE